MADAPYTGPLKVCNTCHEPKPATADYYWRAKHGPDGLQRMCRVCKRRLMKEGEARTKAAKRAAGTIPTTHEVPQRALQALQPKATRPIRKSGRELLFEVMTERQQRRLYEVALALALGEDLPKGSTKPDKDLLKELFRGTIGREIANDDDDSALARFERRFWESAARPPAPDRPDGLGGLPVGGGGVRPASGPDALPPGDAPEREASED